MIKIGLTGSIAMGKSEVARVLMSQDLPLFDADREVHQIYESGRGAELLRPITPTAVTGGKVNRQILSSLILQDPNLLAKIETVIHAEITKRREAFTKAAQAQGKSIIVYDVPLLLEKQLEKTVDVIVVVSTPAHLQRARALARDGMTEAKLDMILSKQMPDAEKRKRADYVIENDGTLQELKEQTLSVLQQIRRTHTL